MKNKDKYNLRELEWRVSRVPTKNYSVVYKTVITLRKNSKTYPITTIEGGAHSDFLNWLESESKDEISE